MTLSASQLQACGINKNDDDDDAEYGAFGEANGSGNMGGGAVGTGNLAYRCKICGKCFKHRRSLNRHVKLHSGEKNFKCAYCSTAFARSDHLKAHVRTHNNAKPFKCAVCQCGYNTQAALKVHIAHHHSKSKFRCTLCNNMEFHSQLALEGHIYTTHSTSGSADHDPFAAIEPAKSQIKHEQSQQQQQQQQQQQSLLGQTDDDPSECTGINNNDANEAHDDMGDCGESVECISQADDEHNNSNSSNSIGNENHTSVTNVAAANGKFVRIAPRSHAAPVPPPPPPLLHKPSPSTAINSNSNTYCEMCNARFSNPESYQAHMRNCHSANNNNNNNINASRLPQSNVNQANQAVNVVVNKMPYLTNILSSSSSSAKQHHSPNDNGYNSPLNQHRANANATTNNMSNISKLSPPHPPPAPIVSSAATCLVPSCACANSHNGISRINSLVRTRTFAYSNNSKITHKFQHFFFHIFLLTVVSTTTAVTQPPAAAAAATASSLSRQRVCG